MSKQQQKIFKVEPKRNYLWSRWSEQTLCFQSQDYRLLMKREIAWSLSYWLRSQLNGNSSLELEIHFPFNDSSSYLAFMYHLDYMNNYTLGISPFLKLVVIICRVRIRYSCFSLDRNAPVIICITFSNYIFFCSFISHLLFLLSFFVLFMAYAVGTCRLWTVVQGSVNTASLIFLSTASIVLNLPN